MNMQKKAQQGFTLIELMIVIAIVGILAAIALPAYQDYIVRSKMTEPLAALAEAKTSITEYVSSNGGYPTGTTNPNAKFGVNTGLRNSAILDSLHIQDGVLAAKDVIYITAEVDACTWLGGCDKATQAAAATTTGTVSLSGSTNADGTMTWDCIPGAGKSGASGAAIQTKYLPANCRG